MKKLFAAAALFIASIAVADVHPFGGPRSTNNDDTVSACNSRLTPADASFGNGCSSPEGVSQILEEPGIVIGPSGNVNP